MPKLCGRIGDSSYGFSVPKLRGHIGDGSNGFAMPKLSDVSEAVAKALLC